MTMRLDCDEEISTARELFELYKKHHVPFSLAIKTSLDLNGEHRRLIYDVIESGGAIVSHSHRIGWLQLIRPNGVGFGMVPH